MEVVTAAVVTIVIQMMVAQLVRKGLIRRVKSYELIEWTTSTSFCILVSVA